MPSFKKVLRVLLMLSAAAVIFNLSGCCGKKAVIYVPKKFQIDEKPARSKEEKDQQPFKIKGVNFSLDPADSFKTLEISNNSTSFFETKYKAGIDFMQKGQYKKAIIIFKDLQEKSNNDEETATAILCLADLYFRTNNDKSAIELYKLILEKYPNTIAAANAKAGLEYIKNFKKYERYHIPVDRYDRGER